MNTIKYLMLVTLVSGLALADGLTFLKANGEGLLTDSSGKTVYVFDRDTPDKSACTGACLRTWPPVLAPVGTQFSYPLSTIQRNEGLQVAYKGRRVYLYGGDANPGDTNG